MGLPATSVEGQRNQQNWNFISEFLIVGMGDPEGVVKGRLGALYTRTDGEEGKTLYVKESGDGTTTGWKAK